MNHVSRGLGVWSVNVNIPFSPDSTKEGVANLQFFQRKRKIIAEGTPLRRESVGKNLYGGSLCCAAEEQSFKFDPLNTTSHFV